ncbi:MAG: hypothetical protein RLY14_1292 [Planctomycetota bacterium]|jgi:hypothetical protein
MVTEITTEWNSKYDTNLNAVPVEHRQVMDVLVVHVTNAHLRGSDFSGYFEVADVPTPFDSYADKQRVQVKVGWFGMKPKSSWAHITLNGEWELIRHYSGKVVHNLAA